MLELDTHISKLTRSIPAFPGAGRLIRPLRHYYAKKYENYVPSETTITNYDGTIKMIVDRASYMGSSLYWLGYHHWRELHYLRRMLKPDMTFIDVGANQGEFTLFAAKYLVSGKVYAFEPQTEMYALLERNVALNEFQNVELFNFGLGKEDAKLDLYTSDDTELHSGWHEGLFTSYPNTFRDKFVESIEIRVLDDVSSRFGTNRVDVIKMDVEGAELFVLQGGAEVLQRHKPQLIVETNEETFSSAGYTTRDLIRFLDGFAYEYFVFSKLGTLKRVSSADIIQFKTSSNLLCR